MTAISPATPGAVEIEFTLFDAQGNEREYSVTLHPARKGQRIMFRLMSLAAEPVGRLATVALDIPEVVDALRAQLADAPDGVGDVDVEQILGKIDWHLVGADLRTVLASPDVGDLVREMFEYTVRGAQPMSQDLAYDMAYRGNYAELLRAVWQIIRFNGFFPVSGIF